MPIRILRKKEKFYFLSLCEQIFVTYMHKKCYTVDSSNWREVQLFTFINIRVILINIQNIIMTPEAERFNGWAAMLGFVAAVGAYVSTGQIIPGWF